MASINIKSLGFKETPDFLYKDFRFDLEANNIISKRNLYKKSTTNDVFASVDEGAIQNSLNNLFSTSPGQKLLDPDYGLDLRQFLFAPVSEDIAGAIGERILDGLNRFEPRVRVKQISVIANEDTSQYDLTLTLDIPDLNVTGKRYEAIVKQSGISLL